MDRHHQVNLMKSHGLFHILWAVLYFTDQFFSAFRRLFCKIASMSRILLSNSQIFEISIWSFQDLLLDVNIDNPARLRKISKPNSCISKYCFFEILFCNLRLSHVKIVWFCACSHIPTSGKNFIVTPFVVPNILGGVSVPQMPLSCLKRQVPINC